MPDLVVLGNSTRCCRDPRIEGTTAVTVPTDGAAAAGAPSSRIPGAASLNRGRMRAAEKEDALAVAAGRCTLLRSTGSPSVSEMNITSHSAVVPAGTTTSTSKTVAAVRATLATATVTANALDYRDVKMQEGEDAGAVAVTAAAACACSRSLPVLTTAAANTTSPLELPSPTSVTATRQRGTDNAGVTDTCVCVPISANTTRGACRLRCCIASAAGGGGPATTAAARTARGNIAEENVDSSDDYTGSHSKSFTAKRHSGSSILEFHMLPFEVREYLLMQGSVSSFFHSSQDIDGHQPGWDCRSDRRSVPLSAAEWFPILPPAMAAKQTLSTTSACAVSLAHYGAGVEQVRAASAGNSPVQIRRESSLSCGFSWRGEGRNRNRGGWLSSIERSLSSLGGEARGCEISEKIK